MSASAMQISELGLKYSAPGYIGAKTGAITGIAADAAVFGMRVAPYVNRLNGAIVNRPVAITRFRLCFIPTTVFTAAQGLGFEAHVTDSTANYDTGSPITVLAQRRKTSGYDDIPESEIDVKASNTAAISGGSHVNKEPGDSPWFAAGAGGTFPYIESVWEPQDGFPLVLEQNEGLIVHNIVAMGAGGAGHLFVGIDFFRL